MKQILLTLALLSSLHVTAMQSNHTPEERHLLEFSSFFQCNHCQKEFKLLSDRPFAGNIEDADKPHIINEHPETLNADEENHIKQLFADIKWTVEETTMTSSEKMRRRFIDSLDIYITLMYE